jgi:AcrR family transcriptional regulator
MDQPGLRERKKAAVRQALHEAALRLVVEEGLEHVTVEAIADAASVSRRTFSNYFSSKEEALFYRDSRRAELFRALLHERPADESPRLALARATEELAARAGDHDPVWLAQRRSLRGRPDLAGHRAAAYAVTERELAAEIAHRLPDSPSRDLQARVLAATYLAALRIATEHWLDAPERPLREIVAEALGYTWAQL